MFMCQVHNNNNVILIEIVSGIILFQDSEWFRFPKSDFILFIYFCFSAVSEFIYDYSDGKEGKNGLQTAELMYMFLLVKRSQEG